MQPNKPDAHVIEACVALEVGKAHYPSYVPYNIHRYEDSWWALWKEPAKGAPLGQELPTEEALRAFMNGDWKQGRPIALHSDAFKF